MFVVTRTWWSGVVVDPVAQRAERGSSGDTEHGVRIETDRGHPVRELELAPGWEGEMAFDRYQLRLLAEHAPNRGQPVFGNDAPHGRVQGRELEGRREIGDFPEHPGLDDGKLDRTGSQHGMPEPVYPVAVDVGYGSDPASGDFAQQQSDGQRPAGLEALLTLLGKTGRNRFAQGKRTPSRWWGIVESGGHPGDLQGGDAGPVPRGRGFGGRQRSPGADHPFYGRGEEVVGRAVLLIEPIGDGAQGALLG